MSNCGNNSELQADEVTALASIYGDDVSEFDPSSASLSVTVRSQRPEATVVLRVTLPHQYPGNCPPVFELNAPWLRGKGRHGLEAQLIAVCRENAGCPVVYAWVEAVRQFLDDYAGTPSDSEALRQPLAEDVAASNATETGTTDPVQNSTPPGPVAVEFLHGDPIEDRRSVFQAHLIAPVSSAETARLGLVHLRACERKIASATHNIWAYRIERLYNRVGSATAAFLTDCDDDGESQAGGRLLRLLELTDARNVLVVVSRWYGGVQLGPDRFKHINNAARRLLEAHGLIEAAGRSKKQSSSNMRS